MFGSNSRFNLDRSFERPGRHPRLPQLTRRPRSSDHPMVMCIMLVSAALVSMALMMPSSGAKLPVVGASAKVALDRTAPAPQTSIQRACRGEAWSGRSESCLLTLETASARAERLVRIVGFADPADTATKVALAL